MRAIRQLWLCLALTATSAPVSSSELAGNIVSGLDTLGSGDYSFPLDFVKQRSCTTATEPGCYGQLHLLWSSRYELISGMYHMDYGKRNLDSIKTLPPDSQMIYGNRVFRIHQDSLASCVGNAYAFKTEKNTRDKYSYYVKIRILSFTVLDAVKHEINMAFLWAYDKRGDPNIPTAGLDTFDLPVSASPSRLASASALRVPAAPLVRLRVSVSGRGAGGVRVERIGGEGRGFDLRGRGWE